MTLVEAISMRIEELMKMNSLTQYRLAMKSGVSQSTISDIRLKKNKAVNIRIIFELSQGFGIELADFFDSPLFRNHCIVD